jgi:hypothetical protein
MGVSPAGVPFLLRSLPQMPRASVLRATTGSSHLVAAKPAARGWQRSSGDQQVNVWGGGICGSCNPLHCIVLVHGLTVLAKPRVAVFITVNLTTGYAMHLRMGKQTCFCFMLDVLLSADSHKALNSTTSTTVASRLSASLLLLLSCFSQHPQKIMV